MITTHFNASILRRIIPWVTVSIVAAGTVVVVASSASAAGTCNQRTIVQLLADSNGAAEIPSSGQTVAGLTCYMSQGTQNDAVRRLQESLNACYSNVLINGISGSGITPPGLLWTDGIFGPKTRDGLKLAQRSAGITVDGSYGPQTRNALYWRGKSRFPSGNVVDVCSKIDPALIIRGFPAPISPVTKSVTITNANFILHAGCTMNPRVCQEYIAANDVNATATGTRNVARTSMSVTGSWRLLNGERLYQGLFYYDVIDCLTNTVISGIHSLSYPNGTSASSGQLTFSVTLNPARDYRIRIIGAGELSHLNFVSFFDNAPGTPVKFERATVCF